ncbi:MAG: ATP-binding protein [Candidatus Parcubacteria bacterium]|nr:ATP-binding protein [Candidatus Parcubacteria bacterium]
MKVSTKLRLNSYLIIIFAIVFIGAVFFLIFELQKSQQEQRLTQKITRDSFQLISLQDEYLLHPSERPKSQWRIVYQSLLKSIDEGKSVFTEPEESFLFRNTFLSFDDNKALFEQMIGSIEQGKTRAFIEQKKDILSVKAQERVSKMLILSELSNARSVSFWYLLEFIIIILVCVIGAISVFSYKTSRSMSKSLRKINQGTKIIAGGNLNYTLDIKNEDEFGSLSALLNEMTSKLKSSFISLEQSEERVKNRTRDLEKERAETLEAKTKYETMLVSINDGVISVDTAGKIIFMNKAAQVMLGYYPKETRNEDLSDTVTVEDKDGNIIPQEKQPMNLALTGVPTISTVATGPSYQYVRKDKTKFPAAMTVSPIILDKKIIGAVEVFRDITKEKEIDKAKTEFVLLASHQLRTPPTSMKWFLEMLLAEEAGPLNEKQKEYSEEIYQSNERMIILINSLLNVSRVELGTFAIEPKSTDVISLIKGATKDLELEIKEKELEIHEKYPGELQLFFIDPKLSRIAIQNVISNAVKYTPKRGSIEVEVFLKNRGENIGNHSIQKDSLVITVSDTGIGIPKDQQDKIFTKLFRADNVKEKDTDGNGLGLYLAKSIINGIKGDIWFESELNKGTKFYLTIPFNETKSREGTKPPI